MLAASDRDRDGHHVVRRPAGAGRTNRLHRVGPARLRPRHAGPRRPPRPAGVRAGARAGPLPQHAGRRPADRPARQGRPPGLRRELRTHGARPPRRRVGARRRGAAAAPGRVLFAERLPHLTDLRWHQLAGPHHAPVRSVGGQPAALRPPRHTRPAHPHRRVRSRGLANRRRRPVQQGGLAGGRRRSTTTTRSTTRRNVGYAGPRFSYASMPDQYTLAAFQRLELEQPNRAPVMAEIDLVSSHTPWAPLPRLVDWSRVGDGSVFDPMPAEGESPEEVWRDPDLVRAAYAESIAYSLDALTSFVQQLHDQNLVLVVLGDHQPATHRLRRGGEPRRAREHHRRRPGRHGSGRRTGAGRRGCGRTPAHRSGRWTPSGTGSSPRLARRPRPRPRHITERVQPRPVGTACPPTGQQCARCAASRRPAAVEVRARRAPEPERAGTRRAAYGRRQWRLANRVGPAPAPGDHAEYDLPSRHSRPAVRARRGLPVPAAGRADRPRLTVPVRLRYGYKSPPVAGVTPG